MTNVKKLIKKIAAGEVSSELIKKKAGVLIVNSTLTKKNK